CVPSSTAHPSPPWPESARGRAILYSILLSRRRHCGRIPQSLRWRVLDPRTGDQAADLSYVVGCAGRGAGSPGGLDKAAPDRSVAPPGGQDRIMIYGPKSEGTYIIEFRMADGESLAISVPAGETRVLKHFQARMLYGLVVPDVPSEAEL